MRALTLFAPSDVATPEPPQLGSRRREDVPDRFKWNLSDIFPDWTAWEAGYKAARGRHRPVCGAERHARGRPRRTCSRRFDCRRNSDSSRIASGTTRRCSTTKTSATTRSTRSVSRCRSCSPGWRRPNPGSTPNCCPFRSTPSAAGWTQSEALAALPVRHREPVPAAGARAGRSRREADVAVQPPFFGAKRRVLGAFDGRRQVSDDHAVDRRAGHRLVRPVSRAAGDEARTVGSRGGIPRAARDLSHDAEHLRDAVQRRLPAGLVPGARARLHEHARSRPARRQHPDVGRREPD